MTKEGSSRPSGGVPPLPHQLRGDILGGINPDHRRLRRQRAHFGDEGGRGGHREMGANRIDALPLLDEDEPQPVLDIDMAVMRQAPRLATRPRAMLGAERDHTLAMLGGEDDVAGDEDHFLLQIFDHFWSGSWANFPLSSTKF